jgi:hypothetical protein
MKYITPKYESVVLTSEDVITLSSLKFEIEQNEEEKSGSIIIDASNIF